MILLLGLMACAGNVVRTGDDAVAIALRFVEAEGRSSALKLETVRATEEADRWWVSIDRKEPVMPPIVAVAVDKKTGEASWIPLK